MVCLCIIENSIQLYTCKCINIKMQFILLNEENMEAEMAKKKYIKCLIIFLSLFCLVLLQNAKKKKKDTSTHIYECVSVCVLDMLKHYFKRTIEQSAIR